MCLPAKAEADKLAWDIPRGAKVGVVASDSPAEKAGMKGGDIILSIDWMMVETGSDADAAVAAKRPSEELRLLVRSGSSGRQRIMNGCKRPSTTDDRCAAVQWLGLASEISCAKGLRDLPRRNSREGILRP